MSDVESCHLPSSSSSSFLPSRCSTRGPRGISCFRKHVYQRRPSSSTIRLHHRQQLRSQRQVCGGEHPRRQPNGPREQVEWCVPGIEPEAMGGVEVGSFVNSSLSTAVVGERVPQLTSNMCRDPDLRKGEYYRTYSEEK